MVPDSGVERNTCNKNGNKYIFMSIIGVCKMPHNNIFNLDDKMVENVFEDKIQEVGKLIPWHS